MPVTTFRKVTITLTKKGWGTYLAEADYKGKHIKTITHDSETYDHMGRDPYDDFDCSATQAREIINQANRSAYWIIRRAYEQEYQF